MLTRIEIDGFKSFERFELALPPFAVILGPNASGKSNLFDALRLLSKLAVTDVRSAMRDLRGEPIELFRHLPDGRIVDRMRLAVETLLAPQVRDEFNAERPLFCTRIRYEITIARRIEHDIERFLVEHESATAIHKSRESWKPGEQKLSQAFAKEFLKYGRREKPFLATIETAGGPVFQLGQDGNQGRPRSVPATRAERSALSTVTLAGEFPHLYALQRELAGLRYLQLDPAAQRRPSSFDVSTLLEPDGSNLAAVLYRIEQETRSDDSPRGVIPDIVSDLATIIPTVRDLHLVRDLDHREYRVEVLLRHNQRFSARIVSDGTLRVLALLTLLNDPRQPGVVCFEEPENGVNKARLEPLMRLLEASCAQPHATTAAPDDPLLQIIVNSHSPVVAQAAKDAVILAEATEIVGPGAASPRPRTTMRPILLAEQAELHLGQPPPRLTVMEIDKLLSTIERDSLAAA